MIPTIINTLGALQIGVIFATCLFGVITVQLHHYSQTFEDDRKSFRFLAAAVWILELIHTICICAELYRGTIIFYGRPTEYQRFPLMGGATLLGGLITMLVQIFFCLRVWKALPNPVRYIGAFCGGLTVLRAAGGIYLGVQIVRSQTLQEYRELNNWVISTLLASGAAIDVAIAVSMLFFLVQKREKGLGTVTRLIDRLVAYTIRTGLLTSITAVAVLIVFQTMPETYVWAALYVVLAKLYSNTLYSALNERSRLRQVMVESSQDLDSRGRRPTNHRSGLSDFQSRRQEISIQMKTTVIHDDEEKASPFGHRSGQTLPDTGF
ncbi:hypothetical protein DFP72DRAFT_849157 [Ephemerocybe angulata]|uniref:DUF6534 domain-containing protein n=1 Tax=Ephemerocybe angulata TaxID=980116 RepID=A0A8H6HXA3_9AGAR|nr:hypothetical protein DFP72DRAFT_849157 [Tulosesus angulatus]